MLTLCPRRLNIAFLRLLHISSAAKEFLLYFQCLIAFLARRQDPGALIFLDMRGRNAGLQITIPSKFKLQ